MKNKKLYKYLAWLLVFAIVFSVGSIGNLAEVMAKSKKAAVVKSVSLKIGNKKVTKKAYKMKQGDSKKIKVSVSPKKGKKIIKFSTSNKKIATINKNGTVTTKKAGTAKIIVTVTLRGPGKSRILVKKSTWVKIKVSNPASPDETNDNPATEPPDVPKPAVPYTSADLNYNNSDSRTLKERNNPLARPKIAGELPSLDQYGKSYFLWIYRDLLSLFGRGVWNLYTPAKVDIHPVHFLGAKLKCVRCVRNLLISLI